MCVHLLCVHLVCVHVLYSCRVCMFCIHVVCIHTQTVCIRTNCVYAERSCGVELCASRQLRLARGAGCELAHVKALMAQHKMMSKMMSNVGKSVVNQAMAAGKPGGGRAPQMPNLQSLMQGAGMPNLQEAMAGLSNIPGAASPGSLGGMLGNLPGMPDLSTFGGGLPGMPQPPRPGHRRPKGKK